MNSHVWNAWNMIISDHQPHSGWINISSTSTIAGNQNIIIYWYSTPIGVSFMFITVTMYFIHGYSHLNPSDLVHIANNHLNLNQQVFDMIDSERNSFLIYF